MESDDAEKIRARCQDVTEASMKLGEAIYKSESESSEAESDGTEENQTDDVVDADFEDLNKKE